MRRVTFCLAILALVGALGLGVAPVSAQETMVTDRSQNTIDVDARFSGERIFFFGTLPEPDVDLVVKLVPEVPEPIKLMRKGKVVLFWMGVKQYEVQNLPYLYKLHSTKPLSEIVTPELAAQYRLGYPSLKQDMKLHLMKGSEDPDDQDVLFQGFVDIKEQFNLYRVASDRIQVTKGRLFQHYFTFPDKAKEGNYIIETLAIKDGKVIASAKDVVEVRKVGITAWLYRTAQHHGLWYGLMAVAVALAAGILVGMIFKGGGH